MALGPDGQYIVESLMGDGTFGRVLKCQHAKTKETVAVKVVKGVKRYCEHAEAEAEVLGEIMRLDSERQSLCVELLDSFVHSRIHYCIVFEPLDLSIRDFLKANDNAGLYLADIKQISRQLLQSLAFLHSIGLTHTDLKCRNVMLRDGSFDMAPHPRADGEQTRRLRDCRIAVIDFGGAVFPDERHGGKVGTRQFRAPEVVLGLPWDESSDIWSAGCIIAMLYLGQRPFSVHEDMEHLAMMEKLLGCRIPSHMAVASRSSEELAEGVVFEDNGELAWPAHAPEQEAIERVEELQPLQEQVRPHHAAFLDVLKGLLEIDPKQRLKASEALKMRFYVEDGVEE